MVDVDPDLMYAKHISASDVSTAIGQQNLILPAGTARVGSREYLVKVNSSPTVVSALNDLPIRAANGAIVYIKDVAQVELGFAEQTNVVRENGKRSALLTVLKNGNTSTIDIVDGVKDSLPRVMAGLPPNLKITPLFDQSVFVKSSISEVVREATIAAVLTGLMILLFLGSWRSTHHRLRLHPALHRHLARHPHRAWRDDQRDDARRPRARGRHPGRRRDR